MLGIEARRIWSRRRPEQDRQAEMIASALRRRPQHREVLRNLDDADSLIQQHDKNVITVASYLGTSLGLLGTSLSLWTTASESSKATPKTAKNCYVPCFEASASVLGAVWTLSCGLLSLFYCDQTHLSTRIDQWDSSLLESIGADADRERFEGLYKRYRKWPVGQRTRFKALLNLPLSSEEA